MNQQQARLVLAVAGTAAPDPMERIASEMVLFMLQHDHRYLAWWRWTAWLGLAISIHRIHDTLRST